jgi:IS30 family transposase
MRDNHQKHLTLSDRIIIEKGLNEGKTFTAIATAIGKDPTTKKSENSAR